jgi:pimeloyl-ACP methyl ester carboxylesterase
MTKAVVHDLSIAYEVIGEGRPWVLTPGGRYSKDYPGVRELAQALAEEGNQVLIWDRPNTGESDVCFSGATESAMQADVLAGLITQLDMAPAVIIGGSGGSRLSLLTATRHRELAAGLAMWWMIGGAYGPMAVGVYYYGESIKAAWNGGMPAVVELPDWQEVLERNPSNRQRFLDQDPAQFISTFERWMTAFAPAGDGPIPGLSDDAVRGLDLPALVLRSGASDHTHTRATSENLARALPNARLVESPLPDTEWIDRLRVPEQSRFLHWPVLAPTLTKWAGEVLA